jgi:hypothetical protein
MSLHLLEINLLKESFEIPAPILAIIDIKSVEDLFFFFIKHILLLNIITIGLDTNYNNLQGSSPI